MAFGALFGCCSKEAQSINTDDVVVSGGGCCEKRSPGKSGGSLPLAPGTEELEIEAKIMTAHGAALAVAPAVTFAEEPVVHVRHDFTLEVHGAELDRSFAKIGWMDPYAIITADSKEVARTKTAVAGHRKPDWNSSHKFTKGSVPDLLTIQVWDKNNFHKDVFCGAVSIPCADDMASSVQRAAFVLTKRGKPTGKVLVSLMLDNPEVNHEEVLQNTRNLARSKSLGAELDHVMAAINEPHNPEKPSTSEIRLQEVEHPEDEQPEEKEEVPASPKAEGRAGGAPLVGHWKCVDTFGLEDFLKATGVGMFQRKLAMSAAWPSWDFTLENKVLKFVNHSAIGDLREDIPLDKEYQWKDGHQNQLTCRAIWTEAADGGSLRITRNGDIGEYTEERTVSGDTLAFVLTHGSGVKWGRNFVRSA